MFCRQKTRYFSLNPILGYNCSSFMAWIQGICGTISLQWDYCPLPLAPVEGTSCKFHLLRQPRLRRRAFSAVAPTLWNILPLEIRCVSSLLIFRKGLESWSSWLAWGTDGDLLCWRGLIGLRRLYTSVLLVHLS